MIFFLLSILHHFDAFTTTQHLILLSLWNQLKGALGLRLPLLLLGDIWFLSLLLLFGSFLLCIFSLLLQLELKVLQIALGTLMFWICEHVGAMGTTEDDHNKFDPHRNMGKLNIIHTEDKTQ